MTTTIEYGVPTHRCGLQLRLGAEKGFFRDEGIDFQLRIVFGGPEIAAEYGSGRLPIGEMGTPPGLTALSRGARFKIIGSGVRRGPVQFFVARMGINDWSDLQGCKLAVLSRGSCSDWYTREILKHHGLDPDNDLVVHGLGSRYPEILDLFARGDLDGAMISEPHVTIGEQAGLFNVWLGMNKLEFVPRMQWTIAVANDALLEKDPELVAAVMRGCRRSYRYAAAHREEWADFGAQYFRISHDVMMKSINREFDDLHFDCAIDIEGLKAALSLQQKLGSITSELNLADIIDDRVIQTNTASEPSPIEN